MILLSNSVLKMSNFKSKKMTSSYFTWWFFLFEEKFRNINYLHHFLYISVYVLAALLTDFILVPDFSHERFLQINLQNGSIVKLPISASAPGIVFDKVSKTLFYSDIQQKTIMSTTLHGKNSSLIYTIGNIYRQGRSIHW